MRHSLVLIFLTALSLGGCQSASPVEKAAPAENAAPADSSSSYPGATLETAVVLADATNESEGIRAEHAYTNVHFPGLRWTNQGLITDGGRVYDVITLQGSGKPQDLYFDITNWFGKW